MKTINITASILLVLLLGAALIYGLEQKNAREQTALFHFSSLEEDVEHLSEAPANRKNEAFNDLRSNLRSESSLRSFIIYDEKELVYYAFGREPKDIHFATAGDDKYRSTITMIEESPFDMFLSNSSNEDYIIDAVYTTFTHAELFHIVQILLICLLVILLALSITLGFSLRSKGTQKPKVIYSPAPAGEAATTESAGDARTTKSAGDAASTDTSAAETAAGEEDNNELYSEQSGFCRAMFLRPRLESELKRAASFDQDLVLTFVRCIDHDIRDANQEGSRELYEHAMSFFPFKDLIFEYDSTTFAVILPNTDLDQGIEMLSNFQHHIFETEGCCQFETASGLSSRNGRLIDQDRIITEAKAALGKAENDPETRLIGFRPDPGKYRSYVAQKPGVYQGSHQASR